MPTTFNVEMACSGCSNAVTRILNRVDAVSDVAIDMDGQTVTVTHSQDATPELLLGKLQKWASAADKKVSLRD